MAVVFIKGSQHQALQSCIFENEKELQEAIASHPELLRHDHESKPRLVQVELNLNSGNRLDALFIDSTAYPIVVEVKLKRNIQSRREVVAQAFDYVSDLSQLTSDELDERTNGQLDSALSEVCPDSSDDAFEQRWRACGSNLRAGKVRLVIVVDEATADLVRIVRYIDEHTDLDVRLIEVHKYKSGDETLFVPNMVVHSVSENKVTTERPNYHRVYAPELVKVIEMYEGIVPEELHLRDVPKKPETWQHIRFDSWPASVHYQFINGDGFVDVDIHLEKPEVKPLAGLLKSLIPKLQGVFPDAQIEFDARWFRGCGRLRILVPKTHGAKAIAEVMVRLIDLTREELDAAVKRISSGGAHS